MINELAPNPNQKLLSAPKEEKVMICAWCQGINNTGFENFAKGVDPFILKELRIVDFRVRIRSRQTDVIFSHGICNLHNKQMYAEFNRLASNTPNAPPCLIIDQNLRRQYARGIFTEKDKQKIQQNQLALRERLQKLANII